MKGCFGWLWATKQKTRRGDSIAMYSLLESQMEPLLADEDRREIRQNDLLNYEKLSERALTISTCCYVILPLLDNTMQKIQHAIEKIEKFDNFLELTPKTKSYLLIYYLTKIYAECKTYQYRQHLKKILQDYGFTSFSLSNNASLYAGIFKSFNMIAEPFEKLYEKIEELGNEALHQQLQQIDINKTQRTLDELQKIMSLVNIENDEHSLYVAFHLNMISQNGSYRMSNPLSSAPQETIAITARRQKHLTLLWTIISELNFDQVPAFSAIRAQIPLVQVLNFPEVQLQANASKSDSDSASYHSCSSRM